MLTEPLPWEEPAPNPAEDAQAAADVMALQAWTSSMPASRAR